MLNTGGQFGGHLRRNRVRRLRFERCEARLLLTVNAADDGPYHVIQGESISATAGTPEPEALIPFGAQWDYNDRLENELGRWDPYPIDRFGHVWNDPDFDVSRSVVGAWSTGNAPFEGGLIRAFVGEVTTTLFGIDADPGGRGNNVTTYLFRHDFYLPVAVDTMTVDALCDDACIIYVDGVETGRVGVVPEDPPQTTSYASTGDEDAFSSLQIDSTFLSPGEHTIAVELHQTCNCSSDIGFEMSLSAVTVPPGLLENDTDPENEGLQVVAVTEVPSGGEVVVDADGSFTYAADPDFAGMDTFDYRVRDAAGNVATATATVVVAPNRAPEAGDDTYTVIRNGMLRSVVSPSPVVILPFGSDWDFNDRIENQYGDGHDYPVDAEDNAWNTPDFDPATSTIPWNRGAAPFVGGRVDGLSGAVNLEGIGDAVGGQDLVTTYLFRTEFELTRAAPAMFALALCDDACIFHVDGREVGRLGTIRDDPVTTLSYATRGIETFNGGTFLDTPFLAPGRHTLAVELHQQNVSSHDAGFEMELSAVQEPVGLLHNDHDPEGTALTLSEILDGPTDGSLQFDSDGTFVYVPEPGFTGVDGFRYRVADADGRTATATVTIDVVDVFSIPLRIVSVETNANQVDPPPLPGKGPLPSTSTGAPIDWSNQRAGIATIDVTFDEFVTTGAGRDDFVLTNLGVDVALEPDQVITLRPEQVTVSGPTVTLDFTEASNHQLPNGVYRLEILDSLVGFSGRRLDGNGDGIPGDSFVYSGDRFNRFYRLDGEFNGDGGTSIFDFAPLAYWFGAPVGSVEGFAPGYYDLNRDGGISIFDFTPFVETFGRAVTYPTGLNAAPPIPVRPATASSMGGGIPRQGELASDDQDRRTTRQRAIHEQLVVWPSTSSRRPADFERRVDAWIADGESKERDFLSDVFTDIALDCLVLVVREVGGND